MSKTIDKLITILLTAVICLNTVFPCLVYATEDGFGDPRQEYPVSFYEGLMRKFVDYKIQQKIIEIKNKVGNDRAKIEEELRPYLNFLCDDYYFMNEAYDGDTYNTNYPNDYSDDSTKAYSSALISRFRCEYSNKNESLWNYFVSDFVSTYICKIPNDGNVQIGDEYVDGIKVRINLIVNGTNTPITLDAESEVPEAPYVYGYGVLSEELERWLEDKLDSMSTYKEKLNYVEKLKTSIEEGSDYAIDELIASKFNLEGADYESVKGVLYYDVLVQKWFELHKNISLDDAITLLNEDLVEIYKEERSKLVSQGITDEVVLEEKIREAFEKRKTEYSSKSGTFYDSVMEIANRIKTEDDNRKFLENVPKYIDEFLERQLEKKAITDDNVLDMFNVTFDGVAGIILWPARVLFVIVPGAVLQLTESLLANVGSENFSAWITMDDIFFNNLPLTDIDIFNFQNAGPSTISQNNVLYKIRQNVADWYYAIRNLCVALAFAVLVYIGIRMAISSVADERAKYKKMLKDWFVGLALIFVLHYFMIFIVTANNELVKALNNTRIEEEKQLAVDLFMEENPEPVNMQDRILEQALWTGSLIKGFAYAFVYFMLAAMMLLFLIVYIKRMITICFLAMIAPLITVTYAIDKAGDGKAQALGKWMGEFVFNVLIQPFHCIIYMVFLQNIFYIINNTTGVLEIGKVVVAIAMLGFMYKAEDIVKSIFGFQTSSLSSATVFGAAMLARAQKVASKAKTAKGLSKGKMASQINKTKNPSSLPSGAKGGGTSNVAQNNMKSSQGENKKTPNKAARLAKKAATGIKNANVWTGKKLAGNVLGAAAAYAMTGDVKKAYGAHTLMQQGKNRIDNARYNSAINERKEQTRDAYQDYAQHKGLATREDRLRETERIMRADPESLTDPAEKNYAQWLETERKMYEDIGSKDPMKDVLKNLADYEDEQI